jgi:Tfp pilus assembly protein PilF
MSVLDNLQKLYDQGQDNVLLRYGLGNEYFKAGDWEQAEQHLRAALQQDPDYSAAWKVLGKVLAAAQRHAQAVEALDKGIAVAEGKGDIQAAKEMRVFRKRSRKALGQES